MLHLKNEKTGTVTYILKVKCSKVLEQLDGSQPYRGTCFEYRGFATTLRFLATVANRRSSLIVFDIVQLWGLNSC